MTRAELDRLIVRVGRRRAVGYLFAAASVALTVGALRAFDLSGPLTLLTLPILASAYLGGLGPGLVATAGAALGTAGLLNDAPARTGGVVRVLAVLAVGTIVSAVIEALHRLRRQAEQSRRDRLKAQTLLGHAFAGSPSPMTLVRLADSCVIEANQAYLDATGVRRDQLIGRTPVEAGVVMENVDRGAVFTDLTRGGAVMLPEVQVRLPDGSRRTVIMSSQLLDLDGAPHALSTFLDITERTQLATREAQFRELAESIHEVFWLTSPGNTQIYYVSPAYEAMFGRRRDDAYADARDWIQVVHLDDRARVEQFVAADGTVPRSVQCRIATRDGTLRSIRINAFPVLDAAGQVTKVAGSVEDITEWLALEEQVRQTQKLESLGLLAGGIAHDFNNILAVIGANIGLLAESAPSPDDSELIEEVERAVSRATSMTRQLLAFSRKQVTEPVVLDLNAAIADTRKMLRRMVGDDIVITTSLEPDLGRVRVDPGHLVQVLLNLAVNARDAMAQGGTLTLTTRNVRGPAGDEVMLSVSDTGCGIPPELRARVFEPLFTTKGAGRGTGLGLSVVHGIVDEAGGRIALRSEVGAGTTFEIYLPAVDAPVDRVESAAACTAQGHEKIVFVDDDLHVRETASRALRSRGYTVLEAGDAHTALQLLREHGEAIDLLVTDVVMPAMDGRELAEAARQQRPSLRVLFTSGYADDAVLRHGVHQAEVAFIEKPFGIRALAGKVRQVLDAR